jgi:hypothetical protein
MNYVKVAKVAVPLLLGLAAVLGYGDAVTALQSTVCGKPSLSPVVLENPDAG